MAGRSMTGRLCSTSGSASLVSATPCRQPRRLQATFRRRVVCDGRRAAAAQVAKAAADAVGQSKLRQAEARWESQLREGRVRYLNCRDAAQLVRNEGWIMLDVRPPTESSKAHIIGATEVPIFVPEDAVDLGSLLKQLTAFGMGGWWLGGTHMKPNPEFLAQVQACVPDKSTPLVIGCQKGMRSLAACEVLSRAGYQRLAWINGGFDACAEGELPTQGNVDIRYAGIGGLSAVLGWTEVQQEESQRQKQGKAGRLAGIMKIAGLLLGLDVLALVFGQLFGSGSGGSVAPGL